MIEEAVITDGRRRLDLTDDPLLSRPKVAPVRKPQAPGEQPPSSARAHDPAG